MIAVDTPIGKEKTTEKAFGEAESNAGKYGLAGLFTGAATMPVVEMGGEAIAARSLRPLFPLVRGYLEAKAGGWAGKDIGGMFGAPEIGKRAGEVIGGVAGLAGETLLP